MIKYLGPRLKLIRKFGILPGLTPKVSKKIKTPGQHGKILSVKSKQTYLSEDYKQRLVEKQKIRFNYGISEKQLFSYYKKSKKKSGTTGKLLFRLVESRLDCLVYRLNFAFTILAARQLINHRHILVNKKVVNIPSFLCKPKDVISVKNTEKSKNLVIKVLSIIELNRKSIIHRSKDILKEKLKYYKKSSIKLFEKSAFIKLIPSHLSLNFDKLEGQFLSLINRTNLILNVNDLKLIEYYSR